MQDTMGRRGRPALWCLIEPRMAGGMASVIIVPGYSSIFKRIRQEAGLEALKLARTMEKTSYKLEAHYRHLRFSHKALEQQWIPKSLRFKPPGSHPIFKRIMERTSKHCLRARISICHSQIRSLENILDHSSTRFTNLVCDDISTAMSHFLKHRTCSVRSTKNKT